MICINRTLEQIQIALCASHADIPNINLKIFAQNLAIPKRLKVFFIIPSSKQKIQSRRSSYFFFLQTPNNSLPIILPYPFRRVLPCYQPTFTSGRSGLCQKIFREANFSPPPQ